MLDLQVIAYNQGMISLPDLLVSLHKCGFGPAWWSPCSVPMTWDQPEAPL